MRGKISLEIVGVFLIMAILLTSNVFAFAISKPHMEKDENGNSQLFLSPGEDYGLTFVAQNGGGATSLITIQVSVVEGEDIIQLTDPENVYDIEAGGRVDVNTLITIPENAQIGDVYLVAIGFATLTTGKEGGFALGSSIQQKFNVVIGEEPAEEVSVEEVPQVVPEEEVPTPAAPTNTLIIVIVVLIILALIIYLIVRNRKRKISQETVGIEKSSGH